MELPRPGKLSVFFKRSTKTFMKTSREKPVQQVEFFNFYGGWKK